MNDTTSGYESDFIRDTISKICMYTDPRVPSRRRLDLNKLFELATLNEITVDDLRKRADNNPHAIGSVRMSVGNMLRGVLRDRGYIEGPEGEKFYPPTK